MAANTPLLTPTSTNKNLVFECKLKLSDTFNYFANPTSRTILSISYFAVFPAESASDRMEFQLILMHWNKHYSMVDHQQSISLCFNGNQCGDFSKVST